MIFGPGNLDLVNFIGVKLICISISKSRTASEKMYFFQFSPFKNLKHQIWNCRLIGSGQLKVIITYIYRTSPFPPPPPPTPPKCYIPSFKATGLVVLGQIFFKVLTIYGHGEHLRHVSWTKYINFLFPFALRVVIV